MFCQTFMKSLKLICNYRQVLSHVNYASMNSSPNWKYYANSQMLSSANFGTSANRCDDEAELYYYEANRRLAKHVEDPNMPKVKITLVTKDGHEIPIEANVGMTVLRAALKYNAPIDAACEGKKACTTCHCYVEENMTGYFTLSDTDEDDLLDVAPFCKPNSRLSCQMKIIKQFDHTRIYLPQATLNFAVDKEAKKHN